MTTLKRTEPMTARVSADLLAAIEAIASARDVSRSELVSQVLAEFVERERLAFQKLSAAFGAVPGVPGTPDDLDDRL